MPQSNRSSGRPTFDLDSGGNAITRWHGQFTDAAARLASISEKALASFASKALRYNSLVPAGDGNQNFNHISLDPGGVNGTPKLTSLVTGAGAAMVALTTCALIGATASINGARGFDWLQLIVLVVCSGCATIFVLSLLHADLRNLYRALSESADRAALEAKTDLLTTGQNRKAFIEALDQLHVAEAAKSTRCLVFIDLDHFKRVNDTLGHEAGDQVLREVYARLVEASGRESVFRLSGDEFALILDQASERSAESVCHDIRRRVSGSYRIGQRASTIGCSIGIVALNSPTVVSSSDAMRKADIAMYKAKQSGTGVEIFDDQLLEQITRRAALGEKLRLSLAQGAGLNTHFQAIVRQDRTPVALEALFRWSDDELGEIAPDEAITIAKEFRTLDFLSLYVIRSACKAARMFPDVRISVNVEASQMFDTHFASSIEAILAEESVDCERFVLEIGESDIAAHGAKVETMLRALKDSGYTLAVDNFGSSNASLTFLAQLGVTHVKLDRSLVRHARESGSIAIIRAKVQLAKSLGMTVTCEVVGDDQDEAIAVQAGCDYFQGYRYSIPRPIEEFINPAGTERHRAAG